MKYEISNSKLDNRIYILFCFLIALIVSSAMHLNSEKKCITQSLKSCNILFLAYFCKKPNKIISTYILSGCWVNQGWRMSRVAK